MRTVTSAPCCPCSECAQPRHELLEINIAASVLVKYRYHSGREWIRGYLGKAQELFALDGAGIILSHHY
jgi:hypothetical protein